MTSKKALEILVADHVHRKRCARCHDILRGSCDRCFDGEDLAKAATEAVQWFVSLQQKKAKV